MSTRCTTKLFPVATVLALVAALTTDSLAAAQVTTDQTSRVCTLQNSNGCIKVQEGSWLQFCPYYGEESIETDGHDTNCISIKPYRVSEYSSQYGDISPMRDAAGGLRLRANGNPSLVRFSKACSNTTGYLACLPDDAASTPIRAFVQPLRMDVGYALINVNAYIFVDSGVIQYGGLRHNVERNSFKFDVYSDAYPFQGADADGLRIEFIVRNRAQAANANTITYSGSWANLNTRDGGIVAPQLFTYIPVDGYVPPAVTSRPVDTSSSTVPPEPTDTITTVAETTVAFSGNSTSATNSVDGEEGFFTNSTTFIEPASSTTAAASTASLNTDASLTAAPTVPTVAPTAAPTIATDPATRGTLSPFLPALDLGLSNKRKLLQQYYDEMTPAKYMTGGDSTGENVVWGSVDADVTTNGRDQVLSFTFHGRFTAFHYDPFVAAAKWDTKNGELVENGGNSRLPTMMQQGFIAAFLAFVWAVADLAIF